MDGFGGFVNDIASDERLRCLGHDSLDRFTSRADIPGCDTDHYLAGSAALRDARNPRRFTASISRSAVTWSGSKITRACLSPKLTSALSTPLSPSRARLTTSGQVPHVIPSTVRTTVEAPANTASKAPAQAATLAPNEPSFIASSST